MARSGSFVDRKVHWTQFDSQMHRTFVVPFFGEVEADRAVKRSSAPGISREQYERCHLCHMPQYGTRPPKPSAGQRCTSPQDYGRLTAGPASWEAGSLTPRAD